MPNGRAVLPTMLSILWCLSASVPSPAQNPPQNQVPSFRVTSRLVELTVVVLDKNGNPIVDLKKEDFSVFDNGRLRNLSICRYEGTPPSTQAANAPALPPYIFTNRVESATAPERNITALVLDFLNTDIRNQMFVKAHTTRLLRALAPETRVAIYVLGDELQTVHDFTDDMGLLRDRLKEAALKVQAQRLNDVEQASLEAEALLEEIESRRTHYATATFRAAQAADKAAIAGDVNTNAVVQANRVEGTLDALEALGRHLAAVPGRKSIVWISGGISLFSQRVSTEPTATRANPMVGDNREKVIRRASERLAQMGIALYGVDAHGLTSSAESLAQRQYPPELAGYYSELNRAAADNVDNRAAFSLITSITGGRFIFGTNDLAEGVKRVSGDLRGSYSLGFYADEEPDGKWHSFKVTVKRPDVRLLHKEGYRPDPSPIKQQPWDEASEKQAMMDPFGFDSVHLTARCAPAPGAESGTVLLTLQIESEDILWREEAGRMVAGIDIYIGEKTSEGKVRFQQSRINARLLPEQMNAARAKGLPFRHQWKPGPDTLALRVLVRDSATNRLGTIDVPKSSIFTVK